MATERARAMVLEDQDRDKDELIYAIVSKITSIICVGKPNCELLSYLQRSNFPLRCLHSSSTPILDNELNVVLTLPEKISAKKPSKSVNDFLMNEDEGEPKYLPRPAEDPPVQLEK